jgi:hypothetical protein
MNSPKRAPEALTPRGIIKGINVSRVQLERGLARTKYKTDLGADDAQAKYNRFHIPRVGGNAGEELERNPGVQKERYLRRDQSGTTLALPKERVSVGLEGATENDASNPKPTAFPVMRTSGQQTDIQPNNDEAKAHPVIAFGAARSAPGLP